MTLTKDTTICLGCVGLLLETFGMITLAILAFTAPILVPTLARLAG